MAVNSVRHGFLCNNGSSYTLPLRSGILTKFRPGSSAHLKLVSLVWILGPTVEGLIKRERLHNHVIELKK